MVKENSVILNEIDKARLKLSIEHYTKYFIGKRTCEISKEEALKVISLAVREFAMDRMYQTIARYNKVNSKRVYYLSIEYLIGRSLENNLHNLGLFNILKNIKIDGWPWESLEEIFDTEYDPALGNGGLGRLAACYLDSMASLGIPGFGYGINYEYGLFKQKFENGYQVEMADSWEGEDSPWQFARPDRRISIPMYGEVETQYAANGEPMFIWKNSAHIYGIPFDFPVVGYNGKSVNYLRLFSAEGDEQLDINVFNKGGYIDALKDKIENETISKVLYPSDSIESGKELRLKQQYFFVSCAIQDIIRRFMEKSNDFHRMPEYICIQLNDTHPALAIPEMMHQLIDVYGQSWNTAWEVTTKIFAYTNHTLLPEALEVWPARMMGRMLPRHLQIIYEINRRFIEFAKTKFGDRPDKLGKVSIVSGDGNNQIIRMANLSIVGSFKVNGVAKIHSELLKTRLVPEFYELWPEKFINVTNGITPRRWLYHANTPLATLISSKIGDDWITNLDLLQQIENFVDDPEFVADFMKIKKENKERLAKKIFKTTGVAVNTESIFIVQAKRIHEYKRQLLNILHVMYLYNQIKEHPEMSFYPKTYIFGAKASAGYIRAKEIIKLINSVADVINNDRSINGKLKVVFIEDYRVSNAELIFAAADISEQISTASKEASGTGNMKFMMNGAPTLGTMDGANVEIVDEVGIDNAFIFGLSADEVINYEQNGGYNPYDIYNNGPDIHRVVDQLVDGTYSNGDTEMYRDLYNSLLNNQGGSRADMYFILKDFRSYADAQARAMEAYKDKEKWAKMALKNTACCGKFSADRTIQEYVDDIWHLDHVVIDEDELEY